MEHALSGAVGDDVALTRRWQLVLPAIQVLLNNHNQHTYLARILDSLESFTPSQATLPKPLKPFIARLVPLRSLQSPTARAALLDRLIAHLTRPEARCQLVDDMDVTQSKGLVGKSRRVMHALGEARLARLLDAVATSGGATQELLLAVPSVALRGRLFQHAQRVTADPAWLSPTYLHGGIGKSGTTLPWLLKVLPPRMRDAQAKRLLALKLARDAPDVARQLRCYCYFPDVREQMQVASCGTTPEARTKGLNDMLESAAMMHKTPEHVLQVLQHVAKRLQNEQSPVVTAVTQKMATIPPAIFTQEHADVLRQLADNALSAPDVEYDTIRTLSGLFVDLLAHCLLNHPTEWQIPVGDEAAPQLQPRLRMCLDILNRIMTTSFTDYDEEQRGLNMTTTVVLGSYAWLYHRRPCLQRLKAMAPPHRAHAQQLLTWWLTRDLHGLTDSDRTHTVLAWVFAMKGHVHDDPGFCSVVEEALWTPMTDKDMEHMGVRYHLRRSTQAIARMWLGHRATRVDHLNQLLQPESLLDARAKGAFHETPVSCLVSEKSRKRWQNHGPYKLDALEYISLYCPDLLDDLMTLLETEWSPEAQFPKIRGSKGHWLLRQQARYAALLRRVLSMPKAAGRTDDRALASAVRQLAQLSATSAADLEAGSALALASRKASDIPHVSTAVLYSLPRLDAQEGVLDALLARALADVTEAKDAGQGQCRGPSLGGALVSCARFVHTERQLLPALQQLLGADKVRVTLHKQAVRLLCVFPCPEAQAMLHAEVARWDSLHRDVKIALIESLLRMRPSHPSELTWQVAELCASPSIDKDVALAVIQARQKHVTIPPRIIHRFLSILLRLRDHPHSDVRTKLWSDLVAALPGLEADARLLVMGAAIEAVTNLRQEVMAGASAGWPNACECLAQACQLAEGRPIMLQAAQGLADQIPGEDLMPNVAAGRDLAARQRLRHLCNRVATLAGAKASNPGQRMAAEAMAGWLARPAQQELRWTLWDEYVELVSTSIHWTGLEAASAGAAVQRIASLCEEAPSAEEVLVVANSAADIVSQHSWLGAKQDALLALVDQLMDSTTPQLAGTARVAFQVLAKCGAQAKWQSKELRQRLVFFRGSADRTLARLALQVCVYHERTEMPSGPDPHARYLARSVGDSCGVGEDSNMSEDDLDDELTEEGDYDTE